jgi:hypothetical protein
MQSGLFFRQYQKTISFVLVFTIVFSVVMIPPQKAVAQGGLAGCLISGIESLINALGGTEVPTKDTGQSLKDQCIDGLFYVLNEIVIKQITADIVNWVNSGFDGNPAFVEDFDKFGRDIADREVGAFLESSELAFLCSPFQAQIKIALARANSRGANSPFQKSISCSLSEVSENIDNFLNGDFGDGGWEAWTTLSYNNPYSDYLKVSLELEGRKLGALEREVDLVKIGRGFMSSAEPDDACVADAKQNIANWYKNNPPDANETEIEKAARLEQDEKDTKNMCPDKIVTPGSVIEQQLNTVLPTGLRRLEAADEINEIVDAVLAHYLNEAITKGLSSLSKKDDSGRSYNDGLTDEQVPDGSGPGTTAPTTPTVSIEANPSQVASGGVAFINWNSTNSTSCRGSWTTDSIPTSNRNGFSTGVLFADATYTIQCTGASGSVVSDSATITITQ